MIWFYDIDLNVLNVLRKYYPPNMLRHTINPTTLNNKVKHGDLVIFFNYRHYKLYDSLHDRGAILFPDYSQSTFLRNRASQLIELDTITKYPLKRECIPYFTGFPSHLAELPIMKVGCNHQGLGKYKYPALPRRQLYNESLVHEEFVENHRAIRVLFIDEHVFVVEHINEDTWIKNYFPTDEIVMTIDEVDSSLLPVIDDAKSIRAYLKSPLLGIDYAVSSNKIGLLEVNDMVGMPDNEAVNDVFSNMLVKQCRSYNNS